VRRELRHRDRINGRSRSQRIGRHTYAKFAGDAEHHKAHAELRKRIGNKMELVLRAPRNGAVAGGACALDETVEEAIELVIFTTDEWV
jgi:hypothetical protein